MTASHREMLFVYLTLFASIHNVPFVKKKKKPGFLMFPNNIRL